MTEAHIYYILYEYGIYRLIVIGGNMPQDPLHQDDAPHWQGLYFGSKGVVLQHRRLYEYANTQYVAFSLRPARTQEREGLLREQWARAQMTYISTLYAAMNHSIKLIAKRQLSYVPKAIERFKEMSRLSQVAMQAPARRLLTPDDKEVLMAVYLRRHLLNPFGGHRQVAITLGWEVLKDEKATKSTTLLANARFARLWFYPERKNCRRMVAAEIRERDVQKELGWKTVNRLARLIRDQEMIHTSAILDGSPDIKLKSGL